MSDSDFLVIMIAGTMFITFVIAFIAIIIVFSTALLDRLFDDSE